MSFQGKTAFVTGAAGGIGRESARAFAREGARVMAVDIQQDGLEETLRLIGQEGGEARIAHVDVRSEEAVHRAVQDTLDAWGRIDCAHNNAGTMGVTGPFADMRTADFLDVIQVNLMGVVHCMQAQIPAMAAAGGGAIVNTASVSGFTVMPQISAYIASKHAVIGVSRAAAMENAAKNIRINCVSPAFTDTPMTQAFMRDNPEARAAVVAQHPIGRACEPHEIADVVLWLCSGKASFMLGANIVADGGFSID